MCSGLRRYLPPWALLQVYLESTMKCSNGAEFVFVVNKIEEVDWDKLPYNFLSIYVSNYLTSLIHGLKGRSFGLDTIHRLSLKIHKVYHDKFRRYQYNQVPTLFVDSGGYSIIIGDVHPRHINKFIDCYNYFLKNFAGDSCDYIFSLDIPIFLKYPDYNKVSLLYELNKKSLQTGLRIVEDNNLYDKFILVWQFKILKQYRIWNKIFTEDLPQELTKKVRNYALGGMVGLRAATGIKFSPFISMVYKLLYLLYTNGIHNGRIHLLGIHGKHDRLLAHFLHKLFSEVYGVPVTISYDTANFQISGIKRPGKKMVAYGASGNITPIRQLTKQDVYDICGRCDKLTEEMWHQVEYFRDNERCDNIVAFAQFNTAYEVTTDEILRDIVEQENMVEHFVKAKSQEQFKKFVESVISKYSHYPFISNYSFRIMANFEWIWPFHEWWVNSRNPDKLEELNEKFIRAINFPGDLQD